MVSVCFQGEPFNIIVIQVSAPTTDAKEAEVDQFYEYQWHLLELIPKTDVLFLIGDWNVKVGSEEIPRIIGKYGIGVQNQAGQRLTEFCQEKMLVIVNVFSNNPRDSTHRHHWIVNNKIRLIMFFAVKDGEVLYNQ